jgi:hypothetical protein
LNSDNLNVTGESFDYGPWRFLPTFDPTFTAAYFDHSGLYSYGNQPAAVRWDLEQFALALEPIAGGAAQLRVRTDFETAFESALDAAIVRRLGVRSRGPLFDRLLRASVFRFLFESKMGFERFFFDAFGGRVGGGAAMVADLAQYEPVDPDCRTRAYFAGAAPCTMLIDEMESLWTPIAERDDWTALETKIAQIRAMGDTLLLSKPQESQSF